MIKTGVLLAVIVAVAAGCTASLLIPTEADAVRAQARWPQASVATLMEGRKLYVVKCGSCHYLYRPGAHTPDEWVEQMEEMAERAKVTDVEREAILQYLVTMAVDSAENDLGVR